MRDENAPKNLAEQKARMIPTAEIMPAKPDEFNKPKALLMADSINRDGLLYPPVLRKLKAPEGGFKYEIVVGKTRAYCMGKILEWEEMPCVVVDCSDEDARMLQILENVVRRSLSEKAYFEQLAEMKKAHAERNKLGAAGGRAAQAAKAAKAAKAPDGKAEADAKADGKAEADGKARPEPGSGDFSALVGKAIGKSPRQVRRDVKAAELLATLSDAEKAIVFPEGEGARPATGKDLRALAALPDEARKGAIKLAGSGMEWPRAIAKAEEKAADPTRPKSTDDMTDEEYIEATCNDIYRLLKRKDVFRSGVSFYRRFARIRKRISKDVNDLLASDKEAKRTSPLHLKVEQCLRVSHPSHWQLCGYCEGTGKSKGGAEPCKGAGRCNGAGYLIRHDPL